MPVPGLPVSYVYDGEVWPFGIVVGVNAATSLVTVFVLHEVNGYKPGCIIENMEMGGDLVLDVTAAAKLTTGIERAPRQPPILKHSRSNGGDVDGFGGEDLPLSPRMRA